ncbi:alpha/beta hydrolase [Microbaculum marinum]|uniref:Alpha/beta hydrolase n=1 Tax=Microbaculum marinum TaxID=1764581 RepID=A0AAW9RY48_9HYPH
MLVAVAATVLVVLGGLVGYTLARSQRLGDLHPPAGSFTRVDGLRMHYVEDGPADAPAVVLLHGASGNLNDPMLALGDPLSERLRVIAIDRPGHGWSQRAAGPEAALPSDQARYVIGVLDDLKVAKAVIVGHSWGGALALNLALEYPHRVAGLVLLAPAAYPWAGGINWYYTLATLPGFGRLFTDALVLPFGEMVVKPAVRSSFAPQTPPDDYVSKAGSALVLRPAEFRANAQDVAELVGFLIDQAPRYPEIAVPTVVITGDADKTVAPRLNAHRLAGDIPNARLVELDGVGHMPHYVAADTVVAEIERLAAETREPAAQADSSVAVESVRSLKR